VGESVADLLEGHLAVQLLVAGDVDGAQAAGPVQPQDVKPHASGSGGASRACAQGRVFRDRTIVVPGDAGETALEFKVGDSFQIPADRIERIDRGQALFQIEAMDLDVLAGQCLDERVGFGVDGAALEQDSPEAPGLVGDPGAEGGHQCLATDEVILQGEQAEHQVVVRAGPGPGGFFLGRDRTAHEILCLVQRRWKQTRHGASAAGSPFLN
jgi:hypothetical protein